MLQCIGTAKYIKNVIKHLHKHHASSLQGTVQQRDKMTKFE